MAPIPAPRTGLSTGASGLVASGLVAFGVVSFGVTDLGLAVSEIWKAASLAPILAPTGGLCRELERASAPGCSGAPWVMLHWSASACWRGSGLELRLGRVSLSGEPERGEPERGRLAVRRAGAGGGAATQRRGRLGSCPGVAQRRHRCDVWMGEWWPEVVRRVREQRFSHASPSSSSKRTRQN